MRSAREMELDYDGRRHRVDLRRDGTAWRATVDGRDIRVDAQRVGDRWSLLVDTDDLEANHAAAAGAGREPRAPSSYDVTVDVDGAGTVVVHVDGSPIVLSRPPLGRSPAQPAAIAARQESGPQQIVAPMPGRIVRILVRPGDEVQARQPLVVIEAMKMENELRAVRGGVVTDILVSEGALVEAKTVLVALG